MMLTLIIILCAKMDSAKVKQQGNMETTMITKSINNHNWAIIIICIIYKCWVKVQK